MSREEYLRRRKIRLYIRRGVILSVPALLLLCIILLIRGCACQPGSTKIKKITTSKYPESYEIKGMTVTAQGMTDLWAGCETFACKSVLTHYGVNFDEVDFAENYLIKQPISYYGEDWARHGPDLRSAFAGDIKEGYGIYSTAMETSINKYLKAKNIKLRAKRVDGMTLDELCKKYVSKDNPVMIWGNAYMEKPEEYVTWIVDYVDENATHKIGDTFSWPKNEHCLGLIGYDKKDFIFTDSVAGNIGHFSREDSESCYEDMGMQAIVFEKE